MRIVSLKCDHCGAPLDVPANREQFNCDYCGSGLHIAHRNREPAETENATGEPATEHELRLQVALRQLDAEWEAYRAQYLPRDDSGEYVIPDADACRTGVWVTVVLAGCVAIAGALAGELAILGLAVVVGVAVAAVLLRRAKIGTVYLRSVRNYRQSRLAIVNQLKSDH